MQGHTYPSVAPAEPKGNFVGQQFTKAQHHAIDEGEKQINSRGAQNGPECRRFVHDNCRP